MADGNVSGNGRIEQRLLFADTDSKTANRDGRRKHSAIEPGQQYGPLTTREKVRKRSRSGDIRTYWLCDCQCGATTWKLDHNIRTVSKNKACGCHKLYILKPGQKFGLLTTRELVKKKDNHGAERPFWLCDCKCGGTTLIAARHLVNQKNRACGCQGTPWAGHGEISGTYWAKIIEGTNGSSRRPIEISVTIEDAWNLFLFQDRKCALTGVPLIFTRNYNDRSQTASLDRIDSKGGYTNGNIQWVHKVINWMKNKFSQDEFVNWCKLVAQHAVSGSA